MSDYVSLKTEFYDQLEKTYWLHTEAVQAQQRLNETEDCVNYLTSNPSIKADDEIFFFQNPLFLKISKKMALSRFLKGKESSKKECELSYKKWEEQRNYLNEKHEHFVKQLDPNQLRPGAL